MLLGVYLHTLAPGLTWANAGSDGGDLITAAYTGGVPHPTGYPLYLLVARLFQFIPIGSLAFRTNLLSATTAILAAFLIYRLVTRTLDDLEFDHTWLAGLTAGSAFGLAPLVWSQAVITEVYALQAFLTVSILYLYVFPFQRLGTGHLDRLRGLVMGLALGNHITTILLVPLAFVSGHGKEAAEGFRFPDLKTNVSSLVRQLAWLVIGSSLYLTLPLRALTHPPINWGNPITPARFWWLASAELYRSYYLGFQPGETWGRIQAGASLLLQQFGLPGVALGVAGLILLFRPSRLYLYTAWMAVVHSLFAILYLADDSYVYLIPVYISFSLWIGMGAGYLLRKVPPGSRLPVWGAVLFLVGYFALRFPGYVGRVDASGDLRAEMFGRQVLASLPQNALVFAKGDQALFALWYYHFALGERRDLVVIASDLLHFDWYQETLEEEYPSLALPGPFPWPETIVRANPTRAICYVQYSGHPEMDCSKPTASP